MARLFRVLRVVFALFAWSSWAYADTFTQEYGLGERELAPEPPRPRWERGRPPGVESGWDARQFAFEVNLGVGAPSGDLGILLDYAIVPRLSLSCGVGSNFVGPQVACMGHVRPIILRGQHAMDVGLGASTGPYTETTHFDWGIGENYNPPYPSYYHWDRADWVNLELGYELRRWNGFVVHPYVGAAALLNPTAHEPTPPSADEGRRRVDPSLGILYTGVSLGVAL